MKQLVAAINCNGVARSANLVREPHRIETELSCWSNSPHNVVVIWAQVICVPIPFCLGVLVLDLVSGQPLTFLVLPGA